MLWVRCGQRYVFNLRYVAFTEEMSVDVPSSLRVGLATGTVFELTPDEAAPIRKVLAAVAPPVEPPAPEAVPARSAPVPKKPRD